MGQAILNLGAHLKGVQSKRPSWAVGLWGEAGVGKSYTVQMLLQQSPIKSLSLHSTVSEKQLAQALPRPAKLPLWAEHIFECLQQDQPVAAQSLIDAVVALLSTLAPFVLHLEDLHEANAQRNEFIQKLALAIKRTRGVGLLITSREEPLPPFKGYRLEALSQAESDALLEAQAQSKLPTEGLAYVFDRAKGNALFTLEFWRYMARQGFFWSDGKSWHWRTPPPHFVPVTIGALIGQLTLSLSSATRAALEARAILPGVLEVEGNEQLWAGLAEVKPEELKTAIADLQRSGILQKHQFVHPLFQEVVAAELNPARKQQLSRQAIEVLGNSYPELTVSYIPAAALSSAQALRLLEQAIQQARQAGRLQQAAHFLGLAAHHAHGEARIDLALQAEALLEPTSDQRKALLQLALDEQPDNHGVRHKLMLLCGFRGEEDAVRRLLAELPLEEQPQPRWVEAVLYAQSIRGDATGALQTWQTHPELSQFPRPLSHAASAYVNTGNFAAGEALLIKGLTLPDLPLAARANYTGLLAFIRSEQGRLEEAHTLHEQRVSLVQNETAHSQAAAHYERALNLSRLGRNVQCIADLERAIQLYDQAGNIQYGANARTELGNLLMRTGRFEQAQEIMLEAHTTLSRLELSHSLVINQWNLALLYKEWQPPHGGVVASNYARKALEQALLLGNPRLLFHCLVVAARVEAWVGNSAQALSLANQSVAMLKADSTGEETWHTRCALAAALEAGGQLQLALEQWQEALECSPTAEDRNIAQLEIARLQKDPQAAQELLPQLEQAGAGALLLRAQRYFPQSLNHPQEPPRLYLKVLGTPGLFHSGEPLIYKGKKRLEMLCYLLEARIAGKGEVDLLGLCDVFYADLSEEVAKRNVKQQMYLIRSSLGQDSVMSTQGGYALGNITSDAEAFLQTQDAKLWQGPYLHKLGEGWLGGVREALLQSLGNKTQALLPGEPQEAFRLAQILLQMEPYDPTFLQIAVQASQRIQPGKPTQCFYHDAKERFLEIGETLPQDLQGFLHTSLRSGLSQQQPI